MLHKSFFLFCFLTITYVGYAQFGIDSLLFKYSSQYPTEKIHLHFDKETYLPGETIWYKAYLLADGQPSIQSTNLYAGLYDANGKLLVKQLNPVFGSSAAGSFVLPDTIRSSVVYCRAWTAWMQNFEEDFLFTKAIKILNTTFNSVTKNSTTLLTFFPEGGNIVEGLVNTIAFKATDGNGMPINFNGIIKNKQTGETVLRIQSKHDGMGRFDFVTEEGPAYYAECIDAAGQLQKIELPATQKKGVLLKAVPQADKIIYNLSSNTAADSVHILMTQNQQLLYQNSIWLGAGNPVTASIITKQLETGVVQLTIFNASWQPLAERVLFVNNKKNKPFAAIDIKESNLQKRSRNLLEVIGADTLPANMSLSITDADMSPVAYNSMESSLLLCGELKGFINNPAYYFSDDKEAATNLDLVLLTHGWRRYNWLAMQNGVMPVIKYPQDNYLEIRGQLDKSAIKQLDKDEQLKLLLKTRDSTQQFLLVTPDATGLVKSSGLVFYDTASVYYSYKKNKQLAKQTGMANTNFSYPINEKIYLDSLYYYGNLVLDDSSKLSIFRYYNQPEKQKLLNKEKTLETVLVKSGGWRNWKNDPMLKVDQKYTTGLFRGGATSNSFYLPDDENAEAKGDIYNYIMSKIGIGVTYSNVGKTFRTDPIIFVNENLQDNEFLRTITINQIAYVKYFYNSYGRVAVDEQLRPTLAVYLKKGDEVSNNKSTDGLTQQFKVPGYSPIKEFYSPDYSQSITAVGTDARTTLLWLPYVLTDKINKKAPITFYTGDFTKRIRIVLEGMNEEGELLHIEKIIE